MDNFRVIQEEDTEDLEGLLVENVSFYYNACVLDYKYSLSLALVDCESPIEQLLAIEIERIGLNYFHLFNPKIECIEYSKNKVINTKDNKYRVDMLIGFLFKFKDDYLTYNLIVECDGFEYHQGNKSQIDIDYERQADLLANGYDVIRFTGSAINKSSHICVKKIINHVTKKYDTIDGGIKNG